MNLVTQNNKCVIACLTRVHCRPPQSGRCCSGAGAGGVELVVLVRLQAEGLVELELQDETHEIPAKHKHFNPLRTKLFFSSFFGT